MSQAAGIGIVCLVGATGTGKTDAALHLAGRLRGAVINFDSRQVYRDLPIVTAQPTPEEQASQVHRLYGFLGACDKLSAGAFADLAHDAVAETSAQGLLPLLVGGTGLYLRSLLHGIAAMPLVPEDIRAAVLDELQLFGPEELHRRLGLVDPEYAAKIHPRDRQRITRALEVFRASGRPFSWWHARQSAESRYRAVKIGLKLERGELEERLAGRIEAMLGAGAVEEVRRALELCPDRSAQAFTGIGCSEIIAYLDGRLALEEAKALWLKNTRAYAKRQATWFKKDADIRWFRPGEHEAMAAHAAASLGRDEDGRP